MTEDLKTLTTSLENVAARLGRIEERLALNETANGTADNDTRWLYLIARPHPWRRQLSIKGRNMTVGQLVRTIRANRMTPEEASDRLELPLPAVNEALAYYAENQGLIELEATEERRYLAERGFPLEPKDLPR